MEDQSKSEKRESPLPGKIYEVRPHRRGGNEFIFVRKESGETVELLSEQADLVIEDLGEGTKRLPYFAWIESFEGGRRYGFLIADGERENQARFLDCFPGEEIESVRVSLGRLKLIQPDGGEIDFKDFFIIFNLFIYHIRFHKR